MYTHNKIFISHSSQDEKIVKSFVELLYKLGLKDDDILCTSSSTNNIPLMNNIYDYLNKYISEEKIFSIFFLSDNYYSSPVCLNEMGAIWLKKSESINILLPGFDFSDIKGVVSKDTIGIKLGLCDVETKSAFNKFKEVLNGMFNISISESRWEIVRDEFLFSTIENTRKLNMSFSRSYCIGDQEREGCEVIRKESNENLIKVALDFNKTESKLSSIVFFNEVRNYVGYFINKKNICFEAYADKGISYAEVEIKLSYDIDMQYEISLGEDERQYKIPLVQFCSTLKYWTDVSEIKFVFRKKKISSKGCVVIKNLRIE